MFALFPLGHTSEGAGSERFDSVSVTYESGRFVWLGGEADAKLVHHSAEFNSNLLTSFYLTLINC